MDDKTRDQKELEKFSARAKLELWEYIMAIGAVISALGAVGCGIWFTVVALGPRIGTNVAWIAAIMVSTFEVVGLKMLGDDDRRDMNKRENETRHQIIIATIIVLFLLDTVTNFLGIHDTMLTLGKDPWEMTNMVILLFFGMMFSTAEIYVGFAFQAVGITGVRQRQASRIVKRMEEREGTGKQFSPMGLPPQRHAPAMGGRGAPVSPYGIDEP